MYNMVFSALRRSMSILIALSAFALPVYAYDGFCGNYIQTGSNAGNCPTCTLTIADNPEILKYFAESNNGWSAELNWKANDPANAAGQGKWHSRVGGVYAQKPFNISMNAVDSGRTLHMRMKISDGSIPGEIISTYACTDQGRGAPASNSGNGWKADGYTSSEENEGRGDMYSASVNVIGASDHVSFSLLCFPRDKSIELAMAGREAFAVKARLALKVGKGRSGGKDAFIDLVLEGQPYPLKAEFYEMNGELNLGRGYQAQGWIVSGLLKAKSARINSPALAVTIPLRNSRLSICRTLKQCGIRQAYCISKGQ